MDGMPWRTPLLRAFAAGQGQSATVRWAPLLSLAVPCSMPQTCPKGALIPLLLPRMSDEGLIPALDRLVGSCWVGHPYRGHKLDAHICNVVGVVLKEAVDFLDGGAHWAQKAVTCALMRGASVPSAPLGRRSVLAEFGTDQLRITAYRPFGTTRRERRGRLPGDRRVVAGPEGGRRPPAGPALSS
jgi:hypothetical protein